MSDLAFWKDAVKDTIMLWPERPTCHDDDYQAKGFNKSLIWRAPYIDECSAIPFNFCGYCGSISPRDLYYQLQKSTVSITGSDWKYGWPHKFYIHGIPAAKNPNHKFVISTKYWTDKDGIPHEDKTYGTRKEAHCKWYNTHLSDLSKEAFDLLVPLLTEKSNIKFFQEGKRLKYEAPSQGYQKFDV